MLGSIRPRLAGYVVLTLLLAGGTVVAPPPVRAGVAAQAGASITLTPATAQPNQAIAVSGRGFTAGGGVTIAGVTMGGAAVSTEKVNFGNAVNLDHAGDFVANLIVPISSATLGGGSHTIRVTDTAGKSATASLTIPAPVITVSPASSRLAGTVTVTGANFPRNHGGIGADDVPQVALEYQVAGGGFRTVARAVPDNAGSFALSFTVPAAAAAPSTDNQVRAAMPGFSAQATAKHSVLGPTLAVSPATGAPGATVTLQGSNFRPFMPVESLRLGGLGMEYQGGLYTDASGQFTATVQVPPADGGAHALTAIVGGLHSTQTFIVEGGPAPPQPGPYTPPARAFDVAGALRPVDDNLLRVFYFDNTTKQWSFYDPRPELAQFSTLTELVEGQPYWIGVREDQHVVIHGRIRSFIAGWNMVVW